MVKYHEAIEQFNKGKEIPLAIQWELIELSGKICNEYFEGCATPWIKEIMANAFSLFERFSLKINYKSMIDIDDSIPELYKWLYENKFAEKYCNQAMNEYRCSYFKHIVEEGMALAAKDIYREVLEFLKSKEILSV